jgi:signal transduction histidine kinase
MLKAELELGLDDQATREELQATVRSAADETDRLAQLSEDLLVLAQSDQGGLPVRASVTDVGELLEQVATRFRARSRGSGRPIEVEAPAQLRVPVDGLRVEQALGNLVDNALRYGGGTILLAGCRRDARVELHVKDEGGGFSPALLDSAFERFNRGEHSHVRAGAGLGLAIVRGIAQAHGGEAHAANRNGGGADVWLSVPAGVVPPPAQERA